MWRDRIPHVCEGFYSLKSILDPRNYLFDILRDLIKRNGQNKMELPHDVVGKFPNISDHIWNNMIFLKYARKLGLYDVYMEYNEKFNKSIDKLEVYYPIELFIKNMEHFKFIRKINQNYTKGLEIVDELLKPYSSYTHVKDVSGIENEIKASYLGTKGYFNYKIGKVGEAHECFKEAVMFNQTDHKIWSDWAEMSDFILCTIKGDKMDSIWFDNTLINYFMVIVFKLDKAKYVIPKLFTLFKRFSNHKVDNRFDKYLDNIPLWIWIFWIPQLFDLIKSPTHKYFTMNILKKMSLIYPQYIYYPLMTLLSPDKDKLDPELKDNYDELRRIILEIDKHHLVIGRIDLLLKEIQSKLDRSVEERILTHINTLLNMQECTHENIEATINTVCGTIAVLEKSEYASQTHIKNIIELLSQIKDNKNPNVLSLYENIKQIRYFLQSKLITESNFKDLTNIINNKLYNTNFEDVEIPGYFMNKITEPNNENKVYITRFESEYNFKFINFSHKKLLIRGSNEKLFHFSIVFETHKENTEQRISQLQTLFNNIFASNKDTYKSNVKFILQIKYQITNNFKLIQEDTNQYYLNEIFDFCMQKFSHDPEIASTIYIEEMKKLDNSNNLSKLDFYNENILNKVYEKMCQIVPIYHLKNFIHKFIINCDEIFIFRKQFTTSFAINNFLMYILKTQHGMKLNKISFNKETGSVSIHDLKYDSYALYQINRQPVPFRLSRNINVR